MAGSRTPDSAVPFATSKLPGPGRDKSTAASVVLLPDEKGTPVGSGSTATTTVTTFVTVTVAADMTDEGELTAEVVEGVAVDTGAEDEDETALVGVVVD